MSKADKCLLVLLVIVVALCFFIQCADAQGNCYWYDTCQDCPQPGDIECVVNPNYCQQCWDTCGEEWRCDPVPVTLPRSVGVTGYHPPYLRTFANQMDRFGIHTVTIWLDDNPVGRDWCWHMDGGIETCWDNRAKVEDFWTDPNIDTVFVRFDSLAWAGYEKGSQLSGAQAGVTFATEPTYDIAYALLSEYGDLDKTIVFVDWEQDWGIVGQGGFGTYSTGVLAGMHRYPWLDSSPWYGYPLVPYPWEVNLSNGCIGDCMDDGGTQDACYLTCGDMMLADRARFVKSEIERRQVEVEQARAEFPDATLRIYSAAVVNNTPYQAHDLRPVTTVSEMIPTMEHKPDLIGVSYWAFDVPITDVLDWVQQTTGYDRRSIFVAEIGAPKEAEQYERIFNETRRAWCWGVGPVNIWIWKQTYSCSELRPNGLEIRNFGLFYQRHPCDTGRIKFKGKRPGLYALQDLLTYNFNEDECPEILALPPTRE